MVGWISFGTYASRFVRANAPNMIRHATSTEDLEQLERLIVDYEDELPPNLRHAGAACFDAAFLALHDGEVCGCVLMTALDETTVVVTRLYVQVNHRGHRLSRALMEAFFEAASERGFARVVLDTDKEQLRPAYELYRSLGFGECAPYGPVDYATATYMEKFL